MEIAAGLTKVNIVTQELFCKIPMVSLALHNLTITLEHAQNI